MLNFKCMYMHKLLGLSALCTIMEDMPLYLALEGRYIKVVVWRRLPLLAQLILQLLVDRRQLVQLAQRVVVDTLKLRLRRRHFL